MPSRLRQQIHFEPLSAETTRTHYPALPSPPQKKQKMSLSQTYLIASSARSKLGREASRADHDLRLLVGHANLLDSLMIDLQDAEREQEAWFNQTVRKAAKDEDEPRHVRWVDTIIEDPEDDDESDSDSDDESDDEFEMEDLPVAPLRRLTSPPAAPMTTSYELEDDDSDFEYEDEEVYEDFEDDEEHALTRIASQSPPELVLDDESDDESQPPSPPQPTFEYTEDQKQSIATTSLFATKSGPLSPPDQSMDYFMSNQTAPMVASY